MIIGVVKEIKDHEFRVGMTPALVHAVIRETRNDVYIEKSAGIGSGFSDKDYIKAGAKLIDNADEVYNLSDMVVKVKEPIESEYDKLKEGLLLFTYLHLAADKRLTEVLINKGVTAVAYETIRESNGSLPLLIPMSEIAGRMSVQAAAKLLEREYGGRGVLLSGVPGVLPGKVAIIGGGTVGINATKIAVGMGADVIVLDTNAVRLRYLDDLFGSKIKTYMSTEYHLREIVHNIDVVIGAVLIPGAKAPKLIKEDMVYNMPEGSVVVDVAIDQGGCVETIDHPTTYSNPYFVKYGVIHYAVANIPGAVARTSTVALTNATMKYVLKLANKNFSNVIKDDESLTFGVNTYNNKLTCKAVADSLNMEYTNLLDII